MRTYGLSLDYQVATVGEFCYTIPSGSAGSLSSTMAVHTPDQNFLLMKRDDWSNMFQQHNGDLMTIGQRVCEGEGSFLKEPLVPTSSHQLTTYDLNMSINDYYTDDFVYAIVSNCKNLTNVEYSLSFENPGGLLKRHFSCQDIGLLEMYIMLSALYGIIAYKVYIPSYKKLKSQTSPNLTSMLYILVGFLGGFILAGQAIHLLVYALDGQGVRFLSYLSEMVELAGKCLLIIGGLMNHNTSVQAPSGSTLLDNNMWWLNGGICIYLVAYFLWTQITYRTSYVRRLRLGEGLGSFGLSVYSPLFGTFFGIITILVQAVVAAVIATKSSLDRRHLYNGRKHNQSHLLGTALYLFVPLILIISPIRWPAHHEVFWLNLALHLPSITYLTLASSLGETAEECEQQHILGKTDLTNECRPSSSRAEYENI